MNIDGKIYRITAEFVVMVLRLQIIVLETNKYKQQK